jgi:hypothetical protein
VGGRGRLAESLIRASGISLGAIEDLVVRRSGRQEEERRETPRRAPGRVLNSRAVGRFFIALGNLGRAAAGAVEAAAAEVHVERVKCALSLRRRRSAQRRC